MRSPLRNALISLIPFYGISSYWYLGRKIGIISWCLVLLMSVMPILYLILKPDLGGNILGLIISSIGQFIVIITCTNHINKWKKNEEKNDG